MENSTQCVKERMKPNPQSTENILLPPVGAWVGTELGVRQMITSFLPMTLFTIAKVWNQPKCPPADEWIKKMWYIYMKPITL
jgi:hypothetical protein